MNTLQLSKEDFRSLCYEDLEDYEIVEEGDWQVDHKWQHAENIIKHIPTGKFYSYTVSRSGSPYSDYYYSYEDGGVELTEVQLVEKVVTTKEWVTV